MGGGGEGDHRGPGEVDPDLSWRGLTPIRVWVRVKVGVRVRVRIKIFLGEVSRWHVHPPTPSARNSTRDGTPGWQTRSTSFLSGATAPWRPPPSTPEHWRGSTQPAPGVLWSLSNVDMHPDSQALRLTHKLLAMQSHGEFGFGGTEPVLPTRLFD